MSVRSVLQALALMTAAAISVGACAKPESPQVTPRTVSVAALSPAGIDLALELDVRNPNSFPLLVDQVTGTLELGGGVELGRGHAEPHSNLQPKSSSLVTSQLSIAWTNLAALAPFAFSDNPVSYSFRGLAAIGGEKINVTVPFTLQGQLTREQLLKAGIAGLGLPGTAGGPH